MRKYRFIFKATLIESLHYVMNIFLGFATYFIILFVFINLWEYIYSDATMLISGYSMKQMIWYVIFTELMWFGGRNRTLTSQISTDIKSGTIAYLINKPYHYIMYTISKYLGEISLQFVFYLCVGLLIGHAFLGSIPGFTVSYLPLIMLSFFLGLMINAFLKMSINVISFWIEDSTPFQWIYDKLILVVGTLFPIELFPVWLHPVIRCLPIFVVNYGPAKLMVDFSWETAIKVLLVQIIYFSISLLLLLMLYRKGVKKLNVNGG